MSAFVHLELSTDDRPKAVAFYKKLFGWKTRDSKMPGGIYTAFTTPAPGPGGGIGDKMNPQQPTAWMPYVGVKSVKATVAKARALGAQVMVEYMPIDGMGALGIFADPSGGTIGVWEAAKAAPARKKKAAKKTAAKKTAAKKSGSKKAPAKKASKKR